MAVCQFKFRSGYFDEFKQFKGLFSIEIGCGRIKLDNGDYCGELCRPTSWHFATHTETHSRPMSILLTGVFELFA